MNSLELGRLMRMRRIRHRWRLRDLSERTKLSPSTLARHEAGSIVSIERIRRHASALDLRIEFRVTGRGTEVPRLLDDEHSAIVEVLAAAFRRDKWRVEAEASYSEWGERGRFDLLACGVPRDRSGHGRLVAVEVKPELGDLQDLLGSMSVKERVAPTVAKQLGWPRGEVVMMLALASTSRNRSLVASHPALFSPFSRARFTGRIPQLPTARILLWVPASFAGQPSWLAGRRRVRDRSTSQARALARS